MNQSRKGMILSHDPAQDAILRYKTHPIPGLLKTNQRNPSRSRPPSPVLGLSSVSGPRSLFHTRSVLSPQSCARGNLTLHPPHSRIDKTNQRTRSISRLPSILRPRSLLPLPDPEKSPHPPLLEISPNVVISPLKRIDRKTISS